MRLSTVVVIVACAVGTSCALTSNAPPLDVHYFAIDVAGTTTTRSAVVPAPAEPSRPLALGRIRSSEFLRDKIVHRDADGTVGVYEHWRWTEYPEVYLRRSLSSALFGGDRFAQSLSRDAPTLDLELVAFEEVRRADRRSGRVIVEYRLRTGNRVLARDVVTSERPALQGGGIGPVVEALEAALGDVTETIAAATSAARGALPSSRRGPSTSTGG